MPIAMEITVMATTLMVLTLLILVMRHLLTQIHQSMMSKDKVTPLPHPIIIHQTATIIIQTITITTHVDLGGWAGSDKKII